MGAKKGIMISDTIKMMSNEGAKLRRIYYYWEVLGCSYWGEAVKRKGKLVACGHEHKSKAVAEKCLKKMLRARPGNCQSYKVSKAMNMIYKK